MHHGIGSLDSKQTIEESGGHCRGKGSDGRLMIRMIMVMMVMMGMMGMMVRMLMIIMKIVTVMKDDGYHELTLRLQLHHHRV
jgi:hypothetical protein